MAEEDLRLVIDSTIMQAAGSTLTTASRMTLEAIRASDRSIAYSKEIYEEWGRHLTKFSSTWLVEMVQRGRVYDLGDVVDPELRAALQAALGRRQDAWPAMRKDTHLIEAALQSGQRILALDTTARGHFCSVVGSVPQIARLLWSNPGIPADAVLTWIAAGTPREAPRQLDPSA